MNWQEEFKEDYTPWWEKEKVDKHFQSAIKHPDFAGCSPTSDIDVHWYKIAKNRTKYSFSIPFELYANERTYIKYQHFQDNSLLLSVGMNGLEKEQIDNLDEFYPYGRFSIFYTNLEGKSNYNYGPVLTFRFNFFEGFNTHLDLYDFEEQNYFGIYISAWA